MDNDAKRLPPYDGCKVGYKEVGDEHKRHCNEVSTLANTMMNNFLRVSKQ